MTLMLYTLQAAPKVRLNNLSKMLSTHVIYEDYFNFILTNVDKIHSLAVLS